MRICAPIFISRTLHLIFFLIVTSGIINNLAIIQLSYTVRISEVGTVAVAVATVRH